MTSVEHANALIARLEAHAVLTGRVVDGGTDRDADDVKPPPYVVIYVDSGRRSTERLANIIPEKATFSVTVKSVGEDANQARAFSDAVLEQFLDGWRPVVAGRSCSHLMHGLSYAPEADTDFSPTVFEGSNGFTFVSRKS